MLLISVKGITKVRTHARTHERTHTHTHTRKKSLIPVKSVRSVITYMGCFKCTCCIPSPLPSPHFTLFISIRLDLKFSTGRKRKNLSLYLSGVLHPSVILVQQTERFFKIVDIDCSPLFFFSSFLNHPLDLCEGHVVKCSTILNSGPTIMTSI